MKESFEHQPSREITPNELESYLEKDEDLEAGPVTPEDIKINEAILMKGLEARLLVPEIETDKEGKMKAFKLTDKATGRMVYYKDIPYFTKLELEKADHLDNQKN